MGAVMEWLAALGGAVFTGIFGLAVAWYTTKQADKRAKDDRDERTKVRAEESRERERLRIHEEGMRAVHDFIRACVAMQHVSFSEDGGGPELYRTGSEIDSSRWMIDAYFPGSIVEMCDAVIEATWKLGVEIRNRNETAMDAAKELFEASMSEFMHSVHIELGHAFAVEEQERLRANPTPLNEDC